MGRVRLDLTGTQQDEAKFQELSDKIKRIGIRILTSYKLVSHQSVHHYLNRERGGEKLENKILASIAQHEQKKQLKNQQSLARTASVLA